MPACRSTDPHRSRLIRLIHVARRELRMDEDSYRALLARVAGSPDRDSCSKLSKPQLQRALDELKAKGFKVRNPGKTQGRPLARHGQSRKIRHLWLLLHDWGEVRDPSEQALASFVHHNTGVEALQWLSVDEASRLIEQLKRWARRVDSKAFEDTEL